ncbi:MAG: hypothetical protein ACRD1Z_08770 [Vicinamibacteria bacterium]
MSRVKSKISYPRYPHDCARCEPRGRHGKFDVWVCPSGISRHQDSLIARRSACGADYASFPRSVFVRVVMDILTGNVGNADGSPVADPKLPVWMVAVLACEYQEGG